jgi:hypothetical protein
MTHTTPAQERYTRFSCPNPACARCNRCDEGNRAYRAWTGTHKHIARPRCTACGRECSAREGTLLAERAELRLEVAHRVREPARAHAGEVALVDGAATMEVVGRELGKLFPGKAIVFHNDEIWRGRLGDIDRVVEHHIHDDLRAGLARGSRAPPPERRRRDSERGATHQAASTVYTSECEF